MRAPGTGRGAGAATRGETPPAVGRMKARIALLAMVLHHRGRDVGHEGHVVVFGLVGIIDLGIVIGRRAH